MHQKLGIRQAELPSMPAFEIFLLAFYASASKALEKSLVFIKLIRFLRAPTLGSRLFFCNVQGSSFNVAAFMTLVLLL